MNKKKQLFLIVSLLHTSLLFPMFYEKQIDNIVKDIGDTIDEKHLGLPKDSYLKPLRGTLNSYYKEHTLSQDEAEKEIETITSYLPADINKDKVLSKLYKNHLYVQLLILKLAHHQRKKITTATGLTIDDVDTIGISNKSIHSLIRHENFFYSLHYLMRGIEIHEKYDYALMNSNTISELDALQNSMAVRQLDKNAHRAYQSEINNKIAYLKNNAK